MLVPSMKVIPSAIPRCCARSSRRSQTPSRAQRMKVCAAFHPWAALAPLIDEVRPHSKVRHANLRQTIEAIFWRHQNGAKWRSLPNDLGP